ncbi:MAG TPA: DUF2142 domain-containing protein [Micromonosporaceae bacterium]
MNDRPVLDHTDETDATRSGPGSVTGATTEPPAARPRAVFLLAVLAFFLLGAGWAVGAPFNATYDEDEHIVRAAGAAHGQLVLEPTDAVYAGGAFTEVPRSLVPPNPDCMLLVKPRPPATCQGEPPRDASLARTPTASGRYHPGYYLLVGLPMVVWPDMTGVVLGRLVSALLSALFLAAAFTVAWRYVPNRLLVAGVVVVTTPTVTNLTGSVNPNGLEITAGIALWTALAVLALSEEPTELDAPRHLLVLVAVSATVLVTMRQLGPLLVLLPVIFATLAAARGRLPGLLRQRAVWLTVGIVVAATLAAVAWTFTSGLLSVSPQRQGGHVPRSRVLQDVLNYRSEDWARQFVARFYGAIIPPDWTHYLWYLLIGAVVLPALVVSGRRLVTAVLGTVAVTAALAVTLEFRYYDELGPSQQGRYYLPLVVGAVLLSASAPRLGVHLGERPSGRLTVTCGLVTAALHVVSLLVAMTIWRHGDGQFGIHVLSGPWQPAGGPVLPVALTAVGALLIVVLAWVRLRGMVPGVPGRPRTAGG